MTLKPSNGKVWQTWIGQELELEYMEQKMDSSISSGDFWSMETSKSINLLTDIQQVIIHGLATKCNRY